MGIIRNCPICANPFEVTRSRSGFCSRGCSNKRTTHSTNINFKHGRLHTTEYKHWSNNKNRCYNQGNPGYKNYGARNIKMCKEWKDDFMRFYEDMGRIPEGAKALCRKDVTSDFSKENCYWGRHKKEVM